MCNQFVRSSVKGFYTLCGKRDSVTIVHVLVVHELQDGLMAEICEGISGTMRR